jgi:hypothetical protein
MKRKFGHIERMLISSDAFAPLNVVSVIHMTNGPANEIIQNVVDTMQTRQPMLRMRIQKVRSTYYYEPINQPIKVDAVVRRDDQHWREIVEMKINAYFDISSGPLLQVVYLAGADQQNNEIIFNFHHTVMDGVSGSKFFRDFVTLLSGERLSEDPIPVLPAVDDQIPNISRGFPGFMMRMMREEALYRFRGSRGSQKRTPFQLKIKTLALTEDETRKLIRQSRKARVTLHSALHAAMLLAKAKVIDGGQKSTRQMRTIAFADLRLFMSPPVDETPLGPYFSMVPVTLSVDPAQNFWHFVTAVHSKLTGALKGRDKFIAVLVIDRLIQFFIATRLFRAGDTAVSYLGPIKFDAKADGPQVTGFHAFIGNNPVGPPLSAHTRLFNGRLWIDMVVMDNELNENDAIKVGEVMLRKLKTAL